MSLPVFNESAILYQTDPFCVVSIHDTSIEWPENEQEASELRTKYLKTRDISLLKFKLGSHPTKFYLRLANTMHFLDMCSRCNRYDEITGKNVINEAAINYVFFMACVSKVENMPRKDGTEIGILQPKESAAFSVAEVNEYFPNMSTIISEVGWIGYRRHFLAQGIAKSFA